MSGGFAAYLEAHKPPGEGLPSICTFYAILNQQISTLKVKSLHKKQAS